MDSGTLPPGWVEGHDASRNRAYYFHRPTRRSTWTKPEFEAALVGNGNNNGGSKSSSSDEDEEEQGDGDGRSFRRAQFAVPVAVPISVAQQEQQRNSPTDSLSASRQGFLTQQTAVGRFAEWIEVYSPEHNRAFFYNKITRDSQWTDPRFDDQSSFGKSSNGGSNGTNDEKKPVVSMIRAEQTPTGFLSVWETVGPSAGSWRDNDDDPARSFIDRPSQNAAVQNVNNSNSTATSQGANAQLPTPPQRPQRNRVSGASSSSSSPMKSDRRLESELEMFAQSLNAQSQSVNKHAAILSPEERDEARHVAEEASELTQTAHALLNSGKQRSGGLTDSFKGGLRGSTSKILTAEYSLTHWGNEPPKAIEVKRVMKDVEKGMKYAREELKAHGAAASEAEKVDSEGGYYTILGVSPTADLETMKKAYRKAMIKTHPDKVSKDERDQAMERANLLQNAFNCLSDPWERYLYDYFGLKRYLQNAKVIQCFKNYLLSGIEVTKHPRKGYPRRRFFWISPDFEWINTGHERILEPEEWEKPNIKGVKISEIIDIARGIATDVFARTGYASKHKRYFSIITPDRTLDIEMESVERADFLFSRLSLLVLDSQKNQKWLQRYFELKTLREALQNRASFNGSGSGKQAPPPPAGNPPTPPPQEDKPGADTKQQQKEPEIPV